LQGLEAIDILGNIVEASDLSINKLMYGNLHNQGHNVISLIHDPLQKYLEEFAVMGDVTTAMRDPIFYRWHGFIDALFRRHKNLLPAYDANTELAYSGITVSCVNVQMTEGKERTPGKLLTFYEKSGVDLGTGLDFGPGDVYAEFTHLQFTPFEYIINVENNSGVQKTGTCRIFMCPTLDGRRQPITDFEDLRNLMIEMDRFTVVMETGKSIIRRHSDASSVTIPFDEIFRKIDKNGKPIEPVDKDQAKYCLCGWPDHMLLPKGTLAGTKYQIFVMISNIELDRVDQTEVIHPYKEATSFCGLQDQKYPDKRAMGFPFDRPYPDAEELTDFKKLATNMSIGECEIHFTDATPN